MRTTEHSPRQHAGLWMGVGILAMLCASPPQLLAETVAATIPSTTAHSFSSRPMIAGTVVTINDHQMVVDTEQGERITLQVDSRTMAPRDLAPGMTVRTEFAALENCRFHADRVIPVRTGMPSQRLQAYANTREGGDQLASNRQATMRAAAYERAKQGEPSRGATLKAIPGTADHHYSTRPLISGTALSVNDHRVVVETDQGRKVALVMDSRTMVPREIAPGSLLRAEFREMQDGRYYAQRIHLIGPGDPNREQAYANTVDNDIASAGIIGDCESVVPSPGNSATSAAAAAYQPGRDGNGSTGQVASSDQGAGSDRGVGSDRSAASNADGSTTPNGDQVAANDTNGREGTLPETASARPLYLLLALLALGSAGVITYVRLRST